ncbi:MAG: SpoIIE family protein phosphatase, partial [Ignavibacteriae bacterium]|nr:SpoIIE family protein phosphatase [Ignavibacteriota bacterium]
SNGILLGFKEVGEYKNIDVQLKSGESIYLITDGIPETRCTDGEFFGEEKLKKIIASLSPTDDPLNKITEDFTRSTAKNFEDDISIIAIKVD